MKVLLLLLLPLLCRGLETIERPICNQDLRSKYCDAWYGGDLHTGCKYCGIGPQCPQGVAVSGRGLKSRPDLREEILRRHNQYRADVRAGRTGLPATKCIPDLSWDDELAEVAQIWADQCANVVYFHNSDIYPRIFHERGFERTTSRFNSAPGVGQNVAWALTKHVNFTRIIDDLWYRDINKLQPGRIDDFQVDPSRMDTNLVTQILWGRTTHVGCGWTQFPLLEGSSKFDGIYADGEYENFFVCNYGVGGNVPGEPVYQMDCGSDNDNDNEINDEKMLQMLSQMSIQFKERFREASAQAKNDINSCLDSLACLSRQSSGSKSCSQLEIECIIETPPKFSDIEAYFGSDSIAIRTSLLECKVEALLCQLPSRSAPQNLSCSATLERCIEDAFDYDYYYDLTMDTSSTTTPQTTTKKVVILVSTTTRPVVIQSSTTESLMSGSTSLDIDEITLPPLAKTTPLTTTSDSNRKESTTNLPLITGGPPRSTTELSQESRTAGPLDGSVITTTVRTNLLDFLANGLDDDDEELKKTTRKDDSNMMQETTTLKANLLDFLASGLDTTTTRNFEQDKTISLTNLIDMIMNNATGDIEVLKETDFNVSFYNSTSKTSFRLAVCLDGIRCEEGPRCSLVHTKCNEGMDVSMLPHKVRQKLSECSVDDILCHLNANPDVYQCQKTFEKCLKIVVPAAFIPMVLTSTPIPEDTTQTPTELETVTPTLDPLSILGGLASMSNKSNNVLDELTSSVLSAIQNSTNGLEIQPLTGNVSIAELLESNETLPIFQDFIILLNDTNGVNETALILAEGDPSFGLDLKNATIIFNPSTFTIGDVKTIMDPKLNQTLRENIINAIKNFATVCTVCNKTDQDHTTLPEQRQEDPQVLLALCLKSVECDEAKTCEKAQQLCLGDDIFINFDHDQRKVLAECYVDHYICALNASRNCDSSLEKCLSEKATELSRAVVTIDDIISQVADDISDIVLDEPTQLIEEDITISGVNEPISDEGTVSINLNDTKGPIILTSSTPIIKFNEDKNTIKIKVVDQELRGKEPEERKQIAKQRIEEALRQIVVTSRNNNKPVIPAETPSEDSIAEIIANTVVDYLEESKEEPPKEIIVDFQTDRFIDVPEIGIEHTDRGEFKTTIKLPGETDQSIQFPVQVPASGSSVDVDSFASDISDNFDKAVISNKLSKNETVSIAEIIAETIDAYVEESNQDPPKDILVNIETKTTLAVPEIQIQPEDEDSLKAIVQLPSETDQQLEFQVPFPESGNVQDLANMISSTFDQTVVTTTTVASTISSTTEFFQDLTGSDVSEEISVAEIIANTVAAYVEQTKEEPEKVQVTVELKTSLTNPEIEVSPGSEQGAIRTSVALPAEVDKFTQFEAKVPKNNEGDKIDTNALAKEIAKEFDKTVNDGNSLTDKVMTALEDHLDKNNIQDPQSVTLQVEQKQDLQEPRISIEGTAADLQTQVQVPGAENVKKDPVNIPIQTKPGSIIDMDKLSEDIKKVLNNEETVVKEVESTSEIASILADVVSGLINDKQSQPASTTVATNVQLNINFDDQEQVPQVEAVTSKDDGTLVAVMTVPGDKDEPVQVIDVPLKMDQESKVDKDQLVEDFKDKMSDILQKDDADEENEVANQIADKIINAISEKTPSKATIKVEDDITIQVQEVPDSSSFNVTIKAPDALPSTEEIEIEIPKLDGSNQIDRPKLVSEIESALDNNTKSSTTEFVMSIDKFGLTIATLATTDVIITTTKSTKIQDLDQGGVTENVMGDFMSVDQFGFTISAPVESSTIDPQSKDQDNVVKVDKIGALDTSTPRSIFTTTLKFVNEDTGTESTVVRPSIVQDNVVETDQDSGFRGGLKPSTTLRSLEVTTQKKAEENASVQPVVAVSPPYTKVSTNIPADSDSDVLLVFSSTASSAKVDPSIPETSTLSATTKSLEDLSDTELEEESQSVAKIIAEAVANYIEAGVLDEPKKVQVTISTKASLAKPQIDVSSGQENGVTKTSVIIPGQSDQTAEFEASVQLDPEEFSVDVEKLTEEVARKLDTVFNTFRGGPTATSTISYTTKFLEPVTTTVSGEVSVANVIANSVVDYVDKSNQEPVKVQVSISTKPSITNPEIEVGPSTDNADVIKTTVALPGEVEKTTEFETPITLDSDQENIDVGKLVEDIGQQFLDTEFFSTPKSTTTESSSSEKSAIETTSTALEKMKDVSTESSSVKADTTESSKLLEIPDEVSKINIIDDAKFEELSTIASVTISSTAASKLKPTVSEEENVQKPLIIPTIQRKTTPKSIDVSSSTTEGTLVVSSSDKDKSVNVSTLSIDLQTTQIPPDTTTARTGGPTTTTATTTTESSIFGSGILERVRDLSIALIAGLIAQSVGFPFSPTSGTAQVSRKDDKEGRPIPTLKPPIVINAKDPFIRNKVDKGDAQGAFDGNVFNLTIPIQPQEQDDLNNIEVRNNISTVVKEAFGSVDPANDDITITFADDSQEAPGKIIINAPYVPSRTTLFQTLPTTTSRPSVILDERPKLPRLDDQISSTKRPTPPPPPFIRYPETPRPFIPTIKEEPEFRSDVVKTSPPTQRTTLTTSTKPSVKFDLDDVVTQPPRIFIEKTTEETLFEYGQILDDNDIPNLFIPIEDDEPVEYILDSVVVDENKVFDRRLNFLGGSSANVVEATVVEDFNYARSVRESRASTIGIATISSITVGIVALLAFGLLIFLALARRRRRKYDATAASSANLTPTQSRTTFSGTPVMADTPSVSGAGGFADDPLNTTSSSTIDPVIPIDGHQTIISSYNEFMSIPNDARNNIMHSLPSPLTSSSEVRSNSGLGNSSLPSTSGAAVVPKTRDLIETSPFLFAPHSAVGNYP